MEYWKQNHIQFNQIAEGVYINFDWKEMDFKSIDFTRCKYLIIWHHNSNDNNFDNLPDIPELEYLEINWSNSFSFIGLSKFKNLKRLELHYCIKLQLLAGIEKIAQGIEVLHINQSKKLTGFEKLYHLRNLKTLSLNDCGKLENLDFLKEFPLLQGFRFVNTNVENGDLTPIITHPKIKSVGFLNKRHYSHKDNALNELLSAK